MSTDSYSHTFTWKGHGNTIIATGSFDDWKVSLPPLNKQADGTFSGDINVPFGQKIVYKYVVDGQWMHNMDEQSETDASGNVNNVFNVPEKSAVPAPSTTDSILPVPESVSTVSGDVSSTEPATTQASLPSSSTNARTLQQQATGVAGQAQQKASETAGQVGQQVSETAQMAKEKIDEVAPQVKDSLAQAAQATKENAGPAAAAVGAAVLTTAAAAAAGVSSLLGGPTETGQKKEISAEDSRLSASTPPFVPGGGEKPQDPSPTPSPSSKLPTSQESIPTIPSNSFIDSKVPEEDKAHSTSVVPKETSSSTAAAPVYDESTAVVAKDEEPKSVETPLGNTAQLSTDSSSSPSNQHLDTDTTTSGEKKEGEPLEEPPHVEGLVAPKENPEDAPLYAAGIAAIGAAVAGATVIGEKIYHAGAPHVQHAAQVTSEQTSKGLNIAQQNVSSGLATAQQSTANALSTAQQNVSSGLATAQQSTSNAINQAPQTAFNVYNSAAQTGSNVYNSTAESGSKAVNSVSQSTSQASESASQGLQHGAEVAESYLEQARAEAAHGLDYVQHTAIGGAVLGALGFGAAKKEEEVVPSKSIDESTGVPNKDITPLPASEGPVAPNVQNEATTIPDKVLTPLPASEAPIAPSSSEPSSSSSIPSNTRGVEAANVPDKAITTLPAEEGPVSSSSSNLPPSSPPSAPLPVPKESAAPLPAPKGPAPEPVIPAQPSPAPLVQEAKPTPAPLVQELVPTPIVAASLPPPIAVQEPPSVTHNTSSIVTSVHPVSSSSSVVPESVTPAVPRTRESSNLSVNNSTTAPSSFSPETPVKQGTAGQQTPYSTAPSTPANASTTNATVGKKAGQEALGQGKSAPSSSSSAPQAQSPSIVENSSAKKNQKEGRRTSGFFSRLFGGDKKKEQQ